ncbi:MAG: helix-turn-helix transcriptional regulator [bacterium]|nr:helix-turn-helix transcriptional regulator [bacterium]
MNEATTQRSGCRASDNGLSGKTKTNRNRAAKATFQWSYINKDADKELNPAEFKARKEYSSRNDHESHNKTKEDRQRLAAKSFSGSLELANHLTQSGINSTVIQLSTGRMEGELRSKSFNGWQLLSISSNCSLAICVRKRNGENIFKTETAEATYQIKPNKDETRSEALFSFCSSQLDILFNTLPFSNLLLLIIPTKSIEARAKKVNHPSSSPLLNDDSIVILDGYRHGEIIRTIEGYLSTKATTEDTENKEIIPEVLFNNMRTCDITPITKLKQSSRKAIVQDLIRLGMKDTRGKLNLDQVSRLLFSSRRTVIKGCKEVLGIGPMELLRRIRLEKVRYVLQNQSERKLLGLKGVSSVAEHYGFSSRGHFARSYQQLFQEAPSFTLSQSLMRSQ